MCDERTMKTAAERLHAKSQVTRRQFSAMTAATLMAALPRAADAMEVKSSDVMIATPDGTAEAFFVAPAAGKHPGILVWVDAFGLRPAQRQMAIRLAESGYAVLAPNPYYRTAKVPVLPEGLDFSKPDDRNQVLKMYYTLNARLNVIDAEAFGAYLDGRPEVDTKKKMGTSGYCMGGAIAMRTAAVLAGRIGATASFHGGAIVTSEPDSPHLLIPKMKSQNLIAIAEDDDKMQPEAKDLLRQFYGAAKLKAEVEVYTGALHGWCPPDQPVYNKELAEKAWSRQLALFKTALS